MVAATHMTPRAYWWGLNVLTDGGIVEYTERRLRLLGASGEEVIAPDMPHGTHFIQDRAFVEAVRRDDPSPLRCAYSDAIRTTAISLAALESSATGQKVRLDELLARA
jgi:predicted dehydrogenase